MVRAIRCSTVNIMSFYSIWLTIIVSNQVAYIIRMSVVLWELVQSEGVSIQNRSRDQRWLYTTSCRGIKHFVCQLLSEILLTNNIKRRTVELCLQFQQSASVRIYDLRVMVQHWLHCACIQYKLVTYCFGPPSASTCFVHD